MRSVLYEVALVGERLSGGIPSESAEALRGDDTGDDEAAATGLLLGGKSLRDNGELPWLLP